MDAGETSAYYDTRSRRIGIDREEATYLSSSSGKSTQDAGLKLHLEGIRSHAFELPNGTEKRYDELLRQIGDAQIVMIGEATHGTHEFYEERARITKRLIEQKDFSLVVCEADLVDMARVDRYVSGASADGSAAAALSGFKRYPLWMWRNTVVEEFLEWAREHNEKALSKEDSKGNAVSIHGVDLHGLYKSLEAVIQYLEKKDPKAAERARRVCRGLAAYAPDPHTYGFAASAAGGRPGCERDVMCLLRDVRAMGPPAGVRAGRHRCQDDEYFFALQVKDGALAYGMYFPVLLPETEKFTALELF
ncbi:hypothetical protein KFL_000560255 [Klebsormidium nitens]|uniref:Erythromycin esterase n=1 Tax=Klebsormidium nitens TaxID=105231 RepID=A0A1Y1HVI1_KLENI|nr:hypothetical protein KFL_000560255 [Klebsormidium nitens]|eukprot:GAQ80536.1 hypothetical protein KFL_000560255 [Klebsormidium nitens]